MKTIIVIPTYNERENIMALIAAIHEFVPYAHLLIVDDNSPDGTGSLVATQAELDDRIHIIHRSGKLGLGTAYVAGFRYALAHDYDVIVEMDADFSHRPQDLVSILAAGSSADVVIGSRNIVGGRVENWSLLRKLISRGGSLYARTLLGLPIHDCTGGFKCFQQHVLAAIDLDRITASGYGFQVEMNYLCHQAGFRIVEVPIVFPDRAAGHSKMSSAIVVEAARVVWRLRQQSHSQPIGTTVPTAAVPFQRVEQELELGQ